MKTNTVYDQKKKTHMEMKELFSAGRRAEDVGGRAPALLTAQETKNSVINA